MQCFYGQQPGSDAARQAIRHLVLTGVSRSGAVPSTLREAADKVLVLTVLSDGSADEEVHRVLTGNLFGQQASVVGTGE